MSNLEWLSAVSLVSAVVKGVEPRILHILDMPASEIPLALGSLGGWNIIFNNSRLHEFRLACLLSFYWRSHICV